MKPNEFLDAIDDAAVVAAITEAETKTSGEIRVFVASAEVDDPVAAAEKQFIRLKMDQTRGRNGVLIYIAPLSRKFAVIGDVGVHQRCGQAFWDAMAADMGGRFRDNAYTDGLVGAIRTAGRLLAEHFPPTADDQNELPNAVERG